MSLARAVLLRMFARPRGILGRLGGVIMARTNDRCGAWVTELLAIRSDQSVLEVGFGPGATIKHLSGAAGHVVGIDPSPVMVAQARGRNGEAIASGRVELQQGSADRLPFEDNAFDKAVAINSMQIWPDAISGLREIRRVMRSGGTIALGFTPYSGQASEGLTEKLGAAGFTGARVVEKGENFCALAIKP